MGEKDHYIICDGRSFQLKCSVNVGHNVEWVLGEEVQGSTKNVAIQFFFMKQLLSSFKA